MQRQSLKILTMLSVTQIGPIEAFELLKNNPNSVLVDVRTYEEFNFVGIVDAADFQNRIILLPWQLMPAMDYNHNFSNSLEEQLAKLFAQNSKDAQILFLCRSGARSNQAAAHAVSLGYSNCFNIVNGFEGDPDASGHRGKTNGWKANSLPWRQK